MRNYYTIYGKDDAIIASGTSDECACQLGITRASLYTMISKYFKGKKYHRYTAIVIDDADDEDIEEEKI